MITKVYKGFTGDNRGMHGFTGNYEGIQGFTGEYRGIQGFVTEYKGIQRITGDYKRYARDYRGLQGYITVYRGLQGYTRVYRGLKGCTRVYRRLQGCTGDTGEQGWRSGESAHLPPMWPGFDSRTRRHMWVEFVVVSSLLRGFFSGLSGFPRSTKILFALGTVDEEPLRGNATANSHLLFYLLYTHLYRIFVLVKCECGKNVKLI